MKKTEIVGKMIGKKVIVTASKNKSLIGIKGIVKNETKNMLILKTDNKTKKLIKKQIEIETK